MLINIDINIILFASKERYTSQMNTKQNGIILKVASETL